MKWFSIMQSILSSVLVFRKSYIKFVFKSSSDPDLASWWERLRHIGWGWIKNKCENVCCSVLFESLFHGEPIYILKFFDFNMWSYMSTTVMADAVYLLGYVLYYFAWAAWDNFINPSLVFTTFFPNFGWLFWWSGFLLCKAF